MEILADFGCFLKNAPHLLSYPLTDFLPTYLLSNYTTYLLFNSPAQQLS